jgi:hypothetical protein
MFLPFEEFYLPGYNAVHSGESQPTFQRNMSPPSSWLKSKTNKKLTRSKKRLCLPRAGFLLGLLFDPEDRSTFF